MRIFKKHDGPKRDILAIVLSAGIVIMALFLMLAGVALTGRLAWKAFGL